MGFARGDSSRARFALRGLLGEIEFTIRDAVEVASKVAENAARSTTEWKDRSGKTRKSIKSSLFARGMGFKLMAKGAALFLEEGVAPHIITARHWKPTTGKGAGKGARFLEFQIAGVTFYRRSVFWHPTRGATHFMRDAVIEGAEAISRNMPGLIERAAAKRGLGR